jgi:hypothetical protein
VIGVGPLRAVLRVFARDAREVTDQPIAVGSGFAGILVVALVIAGVAVIARADDSDEQPPGDYALEFTPGTIARLGTRPDAPESSGAETPPETPPPPDAPPPEPPDPQPSTFTDDETTPPAPPKPKPQLPRPPKPEVPRPHGDPDQPGPPSVEPRGNIWGDPDGWDDLTRDGDEWATGVVKALEALPVGWFAGKPAPGEFKFRISVCKDGKISDVVKKGGTMERDGQDAVLLALEQFHLPPIPKRIADHMPARCARIDHTFVWSGDTVK